MMQRYQTSTEPSSSLLKTICDQIANENDAPALRQLAEKSGWPLSIDFKAIPGRLNAVAEDIKGMVTNDIILVNSVAWKLFLLILGERGVTLVQFSSCKSEQKVEIGNSYNTSG